MNVSCANMVGQFQMAYISAFVLLLFSFKCFNNSAHLSLQNFGDHIVTFTIVSESVEMFFHSAKKNMQSKIIYIFHYVKH